MVYLAAVRLCVDEMIDFPVLLSKHGKLYNSHPIFPIFNPCSLTPLNTLGRRICMFSSQAKCIEIIICMNT